MTVIVVTNGYNGIGTDETGQSYASLLGLTNLSFRDIYNQDRETDISANNGVIFNDDNTYYVVGYSNKVFTIEKRVKSISKFRFNDNRTIETHTVETTHTFPTGSWSGKSMTVYNGSAYFMASGGNRIIKICKISLADFTAEDLTINFPFDYSFPTSYPESWQANRLPIYDGYLYLVQANKVYKININNVADIKELDNPDGVQIATSVGPIYKSGDLLFAGNRNFGICIYKDTIRRGPTDVNFDSNTDYQNTMAATNLDGAITRINPNKQIYQFLAPNFITTAHNYNNKVTKTPDMTMKLTYTIREA